MAGKLQPMQEKQDIAQIPAEQTTKQNTETQNRHTVPKTLTGLSTVCEVIPMEVAISSCLKALRMSSVTSYVDHSSVLVGTA